MHFTHFLFEHWSTGHRLCSLQAGTGEHWALECPPTGGHWRALELECLTDGQALELESEGKWGTPSSSQALCALWAAKQGEIHRKVERREVKGA